jgi:hypothetical protein
MSSQEANNGKGERPELVLWSDNSATALALAESLRDHDYTVLRIATAAPEPVLLADHCFLAGYGAIASQLLR